MTPVNAIIETLPAPVIGIVPDCSVLASDVSITEAPMSPTMTIASGAPVISIVSRSAFVDETVETSLAPVVDEGSLDDDSWTVFSKRRRGRKGKGKVMSAIDGKG